MGRSAFIDITGRDQGVLYLFDKGGDLAGEVRFEIDGDFGIHAGDIPRDVEDCWLSLPVGMLDFRVLELPLSDRRKVREVLPFELEGMILGHTDRYCIDAVSIGDRGGRHGWLAAYIEKAVLGRLLAGLSAVGLDPRAATSLELGWVAGRGPSDEELPGLLAGGADIAVDQRPALARSEMGSLTIDLRTGELSYTREAEKSRRSLRLTAAAFIALALVISADIGIMSLGAGKEADRLENEIISAYSKVFPAETVKGTQGVTMKLQSSLLELRRKAASFRGISPLDLMSKMESAIVPGVTLKDITMEAQRVVLSGEAGSLSQVEAFKGNLEGVLSEVSISNTEQSSSDKVVFTITAGGGDG